MYKTCNDLKNELESKETHLAARVTVVQGLDCQEIGTRETVIESRPEYVQLEELKAASEDLASTLRDETQYTQTLEMMCQRDEIKHVADEKLVVQQGQQRQVKAKVENAWAHRESELRNDLG